MCVFGVFNMCNDGETLRGQHVHEGAAGFSSLLAVRPVTTIQFTGRYVVTGNITIHNQNTQNENVNKLNYNKDKK